MGKNTSNSHSMALFRTLSQTSCFLLRHFLWTPTNHSSHLKGFLLLLALFFLFFQKIIFISICFLFHSLHFLYMSFLKRSSFFWTLSFVFMTCLCLLSAFKVSEFMGRKLNPSLQVCTMRHDSMIIYLFIYCQTP